MAWVVYVLALALARRSQAQTVTSSFETNSAPGWVFGSANTNTFIPFLTSGNIDPSGQGWLRMTDNNQNESTYALYTGGTITGAGRSVFASFDFTFWDQGGIGAADGLTFFLYDASQTFSVGAYGGSLGYAQKTGINGLSGGYLGIGLDVFGNYSNPTEGRTGGPGFLPNEVVVRGPGSGQTGYDYIVGTGNGAYPALNPSTQSLNFGASTSRPLQSGASYRHATMTLSPAGILDVYLTFGAGSTPTLVMTADLSAYTRPAQLGFGYTASTGSGTEFTEIRNFISSSVVANIWGNGGGTSLWSDQNDWHPNFVPISGAQVIFDNTYATGNQLVNLSGVTNTVSTLNFDAPFNYTLTNGVVNFATNGTPGALGINTTKLNGNGAVTLYTGITTTGDLNIQNYGGGTLTFDGTISPGTNNLFFSGSIDTVVNGVISGSGYVTQLGTNTLWLNGANTYSGGTILGAGTIAIGNSSALGSGAFTIAGGAIEATGGSRTITNATTLVGNVQITGANNLTLNGTLLNSSTNNTITVNNTGTTTFGGNITLSESSAQRSLTFNGSGNATINGVISDGSSAGSGGSSLVMSGTGNLTLGSTNSYKGGTIVNSGTITLGVNSCLNNSGSLTLSGGTLNLNNKNQIVGQLSFNNGSIDMGTAGGNYFGFNSAGTAAGTLSILDYKTSDQIGVLLTGLPGTNFLNSIYFAGYGSGAVVVSNNVAFGGFGSGWDVLAPNVSNTFTWNGGAGGNNWGSGNNWVGTTSPGAGSATTKVTFTGTTRLAPVLNVNSTVNVLNFDTNAGAFTLTASSSHKLTMDGIFPSILNQSTNFEILNLPIVLNQTNIVDVIGSGALLLTNTVSGIGGIDKQGAGKLILASANTFGGQNTIEGGVVNIQNNTALGNASNPTLVDNGASLELQTNKQNASLTVNLPLTLNGLGANNSGALRNILGVNTFSGAVTLASDSRINSDASTLTLSGGIISTNANANLYVGGAGNTTISGQINTGAGGLTKDGAGDVTLSKSGGNAFTGGTTVNGGILDLADANAANATVGTNVFINGGGTIRLQDSQQIPAGGNITLNGSGILNFNGFTNTIGVLNSSSFGSQLQLGGGLVEINSFQNSIFDGTISGTGKLDKEGPNTLSLAGTNTYSGGTTVGGGIVSLQSGGALGSGSVTISNTAAVQLQGGISVGNNAFTVNGTGSFSNGVLANLSGTNSIGGAVTLAGNSMIGSQNGTLILNGGISGSGKNLTVDGAGNVTLHGAITTGAGNLTDIGTGILTLGGTNTFTGGITANGGGTLSFDTPNANCIPSGAITLNNSTTLLFGANNQISPSVNINSGGGSTISVGATTQTAGTLTLTGNSYVAFSGGTGGSISFAASTASGWVGTLFVDNWVGGDTLKFSNNNLGLGSGGPIFTNIVFVNPGGVSGFDFGQILANGVVTPVPEVGSFVYGGLLAGLVAFRHRRRLKTWLSLPAGK
jgi:fibronectin-binding autotransporter adhesin